MDKRLTENSNKSAYFPALTGIRAIAAYMVYIHHFNPAEDASKYLKYFFDEFHVGVTFFFVLSGFLISYRYFDDAKKFREYIANRFARIYPMYFLLTTLNFVMYAISFDRIVLYFLNLTFLRGFFSQYKFSMVAQGWSLTVEETFYFLAPFFLFMIRKSKYYIAILPIFTIAFGTVLVLIFRKVNFFGFMDSFEFMFTYTFWGRCGEFFIGTLLAIQLKSGNSIYRFIKYKTYMGLAIITLGILMLSIIRQHYHIDFGIRHPWGVIINNLLLPLFGIGLFFEGLITENNFITRLLSSRLFVLLGKSSYAFYLIHLGIIQAIVYMAIGYFHFQSVIEYTFVFIGLNIVALLLFLFIEEPLNRVLRLKLSPKRQLKLLPATNLSNPEASQP